MINRLRAVDEQTMLRDLQQLSTRGHDLEFRGRHGETPVTAESPSCLPPFLYLLILFASLYNAILRRISLTIHILLLHYFRRYFVFFWQIQFVLFSSASMLTQS